MIRVEINEIETKQTTEEINKTKNWSIYFFKDKQINKPLARPAKKKMEVAQVNKIRTERRQVIISTQEIQRITRDYYKQLYTNKLDNVEEIDVFLKTYNLQKLNHEEIEKLNTTSMYDKKSQLNRNRRKIPQYNKGHV